MSFIRQFLFREYSRRINKITQQSPSSIQNKYKESKYPVESSVPKITISVYLDPKNEKSRFIKNGLRMVFFSFFFFLFQDVVGGVRRICSLLEKLNKGLPITKLCFVKFLNS